MILEGTANDDQIRIAGFFISIFCTNDLEKREGDIFFSFDNLESREERKGEKSIGKKEKWTDEKDGVSG